MAAVQELASPKANGFWVFNSPMLRVLRVEMVINSPWMLSKNWLVQKQMDFGVNTPRSDEDRLKLMELMVFLMKKGVCDEFGLNVARLSKFLLSGKYAAEGFEQIIVFLSGSYINHALIVNPHVYISCIKQFWSTAVVKCSGDVTRLQTLVDKKRIVITEEVFYEILQLNDAEGVICLPNEEIFAGLARMGYEKPDALRLDDAKALDCLPNEEIFAELARIGFEKPLTKLTFYRAFFLSQWKFLIHTILQCMSAKRTSWNEFSSSMASAVICLSSEGDADEHVEEVNTGDAAEGDDSAAHGEVPTVAEEQSIPSPTPPSPPPQPPQDIPSTSQVQQTPPQSPQVQPPSPQTQPQPQPQQAVDFPMSHLQEAIDACRVKKLEKRNKVRVLKLKRLQKIRTSQMVETSNDIMMDDESNQGRMITKMDQDDAVVLKDDKEENKEVADAVKDVEKAKVDKSAQVQGRQAESQAEIYKIDMDHANKVLSMQEDETEPAKVQEVVDVVTTTKLITKVVNAASAIITTDEAQVPAATTATLIAAPARVTAAPSRRRKGVIIRDPEEESATSTIIPAETKELHVELNKDIDWDEAIDHVKLKAKEDPVVKRYQAMKRKPQTEAQARKNMMMYLKNVAGFKVKKLERLNKVKSSKLKRLKKVGTSQRIESSKDEDNVFNQGRMSVDINKGINIPIPAAKPAVVAVSTPISAAKPAAKPKVLKMVPAALAISTRKRKGVIIRDPEEELHDDTPAETLSAKDKGKGILVEDPKPMKKKDQIEMDAEYARKLQKEKESHVQAKDVQAKGIQYIRRYHGYKKKP
nr:hypothetical protein [Tanacetum cinerariifolium]